MDDLLQFDLNGDGVVDSLDLDLNGDGIVNGLDFDVNGDGVVNGLDFDVNGDGVLDNQDVDIAQPMSSNFERLLNKFDDELDETQRMLNGESGYGFVRTKLIQNDFTDA